MSSWLIDPSGESRWTTSSRFGLSFSVTTPTRRTTSGSRGSAAATRFWTCTCAMSRSVPNANVTVRVIDPSLADWLSM